MKSPVFFTFFLSCVYFACTPPESVRLQEYSQQAINGYFAHIPVELLAFDLSLGESVRETEEQLGARIELIDTENEENKFSRFAIRHPNLNADTIVSCGFRNGRLCAVSAKTTFRQSIEQHDEVLEKLEDVYGFLSELHGNLNLNRSLEYVQTDSIYCKKFIFHKASNGFKGFEYLISYTNDAESFQLILNT